MIAPSIEEALANTTARAAVSGCTGRVPGLRWIRARRLKPSTNSTTAITKSVLPASFGNGGNESYASLSSRCASRPAIRPAASRSRGLVNLTSPYSQLRVVSEVEAHSPIRRWVTGEPAPSQRHRLCSNSPAES